MASSVRPAQVHAKQKHYELILLDLGLPDGSGNEVASLNRQDRDSPNQATPMVMAISPHIDQQHKKLCQLAGINAVLAKPLSEELACQVLKIFLAH